MNIRKPPPLNSQAQKKVKTSKDVQMPTILSAPQGFKGLPQQRPQMPPLISRNPNADVPAPLFIQPKTTVPSNISTPRDQQRLPQQQPQSRSNSGRGAPVPQSLDITGKLHKLNLPKQYQDVLGDDPELLKKYAERKHRKEKAIKTAIEEGKIKIVKHEKSKEKESVDPQKIMMSEDGKLKNIQGGIIVQKEDNKALKVNESKRKEQKIKEIQKKQKQLREAINERGKFYDRNLSVPLFGNTGKRAKHKVLALNFVEKDKDSVNESIDLTTLQSIQQEPIEVENGEASMDIETADKGTKAPVLQQQPIILSQGSSFKRVAVKIKHYDPIPNIEWWDIPLFPVEQGSYIPSSTEQRGIKQPATAHTQEEIEQNIKFMQDFQFMEEHIRLEKLTHYVEHPEPFKVSDIVQSRERATIKTYLTKQERKRLRRRRRAEQEKEKQDEIRLGLRKPDPPKIKLSNMMRILGTEAVIDPSKAEKEVRKQMQERYEKHIQHNESRKLTKEERGEKLKKKWERDAAQEIRLAVFKIQDLTNPQLKFKVNMNAQQVNLHGVCLFTGQGKQIPSIVVAEGGPKGIKHFKKLLLNRIKWDQYQKEGEPNNGCTLIWEGIQKQRSFNKWRQIEMKSEADGRGALAEKNMDQLWDLAMKN